MDTRFVDMLRPFLNSAEGKQITPESNLRELGLDSMQAIELLFAIEDTFGVSIPDEDMTDSTFATAGNLWDVIAAASADSAQVGGAA